MRQYAYWLDSEYIAIVSRLGLASGDPIDLCITNLKVQALQGVQFLIADQQVSDNAITATLFSDDEFCAFLRRHSDFLAYCSAEGQDRFSQITHGLRAALAKPGWRSSILRDPTPILELAKAILIDGEQPWPQPLGRRVLTDHCVG